MLNPKRCVILRKGKSSGTSTQQKSGYYIIVVFWGRYRKPQLKKKNKKMNLRLGAKEKVIKRNSSPGKHIILWWFLLRHLLTSCVCVVLRPISCLLIPRGGNKFCYPRQRI